MGRRPKNAGFTSLVTMLLLISTLPLAGCDADRDQKAETSPSARSETASTAKSSMDGAKPVHVGAAVCETCHPAETERWRGSHHDLAMQPASAETVLGDFDDITFEHRGERFVFSIEGDRFSVRTAGEDGTVADFEISHTFGVEPLQQYLIPLPDGRRQALTVAWDTRPASEGGQRWIHLHPDEATPPGDVLHWTGPAYNWNTMCADCHSTGYAKGYRADERRYASTWAEIDVSCEACHGPGSQHVAWANAGASADRLDRGLVVPPAQDRAWQFVDGAPIARRVPPADAASQREVDTCAPCHARRSRIAEADGAGGAFLDHYLPALIEDGLYFADGQIRDEVYVWGSFLQSRMHAAGVVCSDCHDPHSLRIEAPDAACARCHDKATFASTEHHHHSAESAGASCVACHMPARTYMVVDDRRDHGFRIPRPDLTEQIGTPNACTSCHADRSPAWAAAAITNWSGTPKRPLHYGAVLEAGRRGAPGADRALSDLARDVSQPAIVRATAVQLLGRSLTRESIPGLMAGLEDPDPLPRLAAAGTSQNLPPTDRWLALTPLLEDPTLAVRIEAARALAPLRAQQTDPTSRGRLDKALREYQDAQLSEADRPSALVNLGILAVQLGRIDEAIQRYEEAIRIGPYFLPAYVNLADAYRMTGRDGEGALVMQTAVTRFPDDPNVHHTIGLLLIRTGKTNEGLAALEQAARLEPDNERYAYVFGVGLHSVGRSQDAVRQLEQAREAHPRSADILLALATIHRDLGDREEALRFARELLALNPGDAGAQGLVRELQSPPRPSPGAP